MAHTVDVRMMIVEAGIIANCVSGNAASATLSNRIATEAALAWDRLETDVTVQFSPFEAGLVLDGLSRSQDNLTGDIGDRLLRAVNKLMNDNGVEPLPSDLPIGVTGDGGEGQPAGDDAPIGSDDGAVDDESQQQGQPSSDGAGSDTQPIEAPGQDA